jgi:hypothetical protein
MYIMLPYKGGKPKKTADTVSSVVKRELVFRRHRTYAW